MARNRKRTGASRPSDTDATPLGGAAARTHDGPFESRVDDTNDPVGHAAPGVEIAEADLAAARARADRPEVNEPSGADEGPAAGDAPLPVPRSQFGVPGVTGVTPAPVGDEDFGDDIEDDLDDEDGGGPGAGGSGGRRRRGGGGGGGGDSEDLHPAGRAGPGPRHRNRLIAFAQGSWRELQRVQWPDQRQVVQATGVVIGFVIVAGAYLGLADWVATKIVNFIL